MATHEMTAQLMRENEALRAELERARAHVGNAARLLSGIYALMYPAPITTQDGRTMVFRPKSPDPHEVLQELSDQEPRVVGGEHVAEVALPAPHERRAPTASTVSAEDASAATLGF